MGKNNSNDDVKKVLETLEVFGNIDNINNMPSAAETTAKLADELKSDEKAMGRLTNEGKTSVDEALGNKASQMLWDTVCCTAKVYEGNSLPFAVDQTVSIWAHPKEGFFSVDNYKHTTAKRYDVHLSFDKIIDVQMETVKITVHHKDSGMGGALLADLILGPEYTTAGYLDSVKEYDTVEDMPVLRIVYNSVNGTEYLGFSFDYQTVSNNGFLIFDRLRQHCPNLIKRRSMPKTRTIEL